MVKVGGLHGLQLDIQNIFYL